MIEADSWRCHPGNPRLLGPAKTAIVTEKTMPMGGLEKKKQLKK